MVRTKEKTKKMSYKIHYGRLPLMSEIECLEFKSISDVRIFVNNIATNIPKVYLIGIQDEVFVTENIALVIELFDGDFSSAYPFYEGEDIFIQEYESYEDAYAVALNMKETSPLCYEQENRSN